MDTRGFNEKDITESLDKITNAIKANGGELPPVTSDDNGKVLKVVNGDWNKGDVPTELPAVSGVDNGKILTVAEGVWAKGDAPSGGGTFIVEFTMGDTLVPNKTFSETAAACNNGSAIIFRLTDDSGEPKYDYLAQYYVNDDVEYLEAHGVTVQPDSDDGVSYIVPELIRWDSNGNIEDITGTINAEPNEFIVTISGRNGETKDESFNDIMSAYNAGKTILADVSGVTNVIQNIPTGFKLMLSGISDDQITFYGSIYASDNIYCMYAIITNDDGSQVGANQIA